MSQASAAVQRHSLPMPGKHFPPHPTPPHPQAHHVVALNPSQNGHTPTPLQRPHQRCNGHTAALPVLAPHQAAGVLREAAADAGWKSGSGVGTVVGSGACKRDRAGDKKRVRVQETGRHVQLAVQYAVQHGCRDARQGQDVPTCSGGVGCSLPPQTQSPARGLESRGRGGSARVGVGGPQARAGGSELRTIQLNLH